MSETVERVLDRAARPGRRPKISVEGLAKCYTVGGSVHQVLGDVSLSVGENEFVSIVGHSGAGKTTLLKCISGLESPSGGRVLIDGEAISGPPKRLALIFQDYGRSLFPWLRVLSNVTLPLRARPDIGRGERRSIAMAALTAVGLADATDHYPWQLSGGMQQRVAIARAIACEPDVLVMDEPFASVDAQTRSDLEDLVLELRRRYAMTAILVTHDVDESVYMSDRVAVLDGSPTGVSQIIDVGLPGERDQLTTKSLPEFVALRARVLQAVRGHASTEEAEDA